MSVTFILVFRSDFIFCICMCTIHKPVSTEALELALQGAMSHEMQVLGMALRSSA